MTDHKPSNPKDAVGAKKLMLHLVPSIVMILAALGFSEGAFKYGKYNWRKAGVRFSIYLDAIHRHLQKLQDGEWADDDTQVPHLASIIACCGIIADAKSLGMLTDDRPPRAATATEIKNAEKVADHLRELFKDHNPHQHTISDFSTDTMTVVVTEKKPRLPAPGTKVRAVRDHLLGDKEFGQAGGPRKESVTGIVKSVDRNVLVALDDGFEGWREHGKGSQKFWYFKPSEIMEIMP